MDDADDKFPSQLADRFQVRMPDGMRSRIAAAAAANNRSMNAEIVARLEQTFIASEGKKGSLARQEVDRIVKTAALEAARITAITLGGLMDEVKETANSLSFRDRFTEVLNQHLSVPIGPRERIPLSEQGGRALKSVKGSKDDSNL